MFWITETPTVISSSDWVLPILRRPIHWLRGLVNVWAQYGMYMMHIMKADRFTAVRLFDVYDMEVSDTESIRIARTKHMINPKLIVLYCHTLFGSYVELSHIAAQLQDDPIIYFSYSRRGVHPELATDSYNITGSTDILDKVLDHIQSIYPHTPIHAIGASAGTCLLIKYLGSSNRLKRIKSAVLISPGYNFLKSIQEIPPTVQVSLLNKLKSRYRHCMNPVLLQLTTLKDLALYHYTSTEYNSAQEYILNNDPCHFLNSINVPTIMISALDDFCFSGNITANHTDLPHTNKNITMVITKHGGHISFIDYRSIVPWSSRVAIEHIRSKLSLL